MGLFTKKQTIDPELEKRLLERGQTERIAELKKPAIPATEFKPQLPEKLSKAEKFLSGVRKAFEMGANEDNILADIEKKNPEFSSAIKQAKDEGATAFDIVHDMINKAATSPEQAQAISTKGVAVQQPEPKKTFMEKMEISIDRTSDKLITIADMYADKKAKAEGKWGKEAMEGVKFGVAGMAPIIRAGWDTLFSAVTTATGKVPGLNEEAEKVAVDVLTKVPGKWAVDVMSQGVEYYEKWKNKSPENTEIGMVYVEPALEIISSLPVLKGMPIFKGSFGLAKGIDAAKPTTRTFIEKLLTPLESQTVKKAAVKKTKVIPFTKKYVYKASEMEKAMQSAVYETTSKVPFKGISPRKTMQQNYIIIEEANKKAAVALDKEMSLRVSGYDQPGLLEKLKAMAKNLAIEHPLIVGDASKTAEKIMIKITQLIEGSPALTSSLFRIRKEYDKWIKTIKKDLYPKGAKIIVGDQKENAITIANREIRNTIYDTLYEALPDSTMKKSLAYQHALYNAAEIVGEKAAGEAKTRFGRLWEKSKKILTVRNTAVVVLATVGGKTMWDITSSYGLYITGSIAGIGLTISAGKVLSTQPLRKALYEILRELGKVKEKDLNPEQIKDLQAAKKEVNDFLALYPAETTTSKKELFKKKSV